MTDPLPAGTSLLSSNGCAEDPNGVPTCSPGTILAGETRSVELTFWSRRACSPARCSPTPQSSPRPPRIQSRRRSSHGRDHGRALVDVALAKTAAPDPVTAGGQIQYTLTVSNAGPSEARDVTITESLPAGVTLVSTVGCNEDPAGVSNALWERSRREPACRSP